MTMALSNENIYITNFSHSAYEKLTGIFIIFTAVYLDRGSLKIQNNFQLSRTKTAGRFNNPILIREQINLAWLMCRSNYTSYL